MVRQSIEYMSREKIDEDPVDKMNEDVEQVIARHVISPKAVIEGKAHISQRSLWVRAIEPRIA